MSDQLYAQLAQQNPILGKMMEYFQGYNSYLADAPGQTIPENPTPSASQDTSAALNQAKVAQEAIKSAGAAEIGSMA